MARKRKTLPKDFEARLTTATLDELKAVFDTCLLDARGGYGKHTAIGFVDCPDALIVWLVEQGLDVDAADTYDTTPLWERASLGRDKQLPLLRSLGADLEALRGDSGTPLHGAAGSQKVSTVRVLLAHGANATTVNGEGDTPLMRGLRRTANSDIADMAEVAALLLAAGDVITDEMREEVERIGREFEFHRDDYNPDSLEEADAGLAKLYALFGVAPAPRRLVHDGVAPIVVPEGTWQEQHAALWDQLVPSGGAATTRQGEVIRITGRIAHEILGNGAANWDRDFKKMLAAIPDHLSAGTSLSDDELTEAQAFVRALHSGDGDEEELSRLTELAVLWVRQNPTPLPLEGVSYRR